MTRDPPQPERHVRCRLQILEVSKQFEEDVLCQIFRNGPITHNMVGNAKHHGLMLPHEGGEGCLIARLCPRKRLIDPSRKSNGLEHPRRVNTLGTGVRVQS